MHTFLPMGLVSFKNKNVVINLDTEIFFFFFTGLSHRAVIIIPGG